MPRRSADPAVRGRPGRRLISETDGRTGVHVKALHIYQRFEEAVDVSGLDMYFWCDHRRGLRVADAASAPRPGIPHDVKC